MLDDTSFLETNRIKQAIPQAVGLYVMFPIRVREEKQVFNRFSLLNKCVLRALFS